MAEGMTCYERDETFCEDQMCLRTGCRIRNERPAPAVTPGKEALLAKLDEIAQSAEANRIAAKDNNGDTWAVHARKVREIVASLRLIKSDDEGVLAALEPFAEAADAWDADVWDDGDKLDPKDRRNKLLTVGDLRRARSVYVALSTTGRPSP